MGDFTDMFVGADGSGANRFIFSRQFCQIEIHAKSAAHGDGTGKMHGPIAPMGDMARQGHDGEKIGVIPLQGDSTHRVGIVAGPELVEIFEGPVIGTTAATRAEHQFGFGEGLGGALHQGIQGADIIDPQVRLAISREETRPWLGQVAVAIPFHVGNAGNTQYALEHGPLEILNGGTGEIQRELVTLQFEFALRLADYPVRMLLEQFAFRINHLRLNPDTELQSFFHSGRGQRFEAIGETLSVWFPITQAGFVVDARVFVAKPSIVQEELFDSQLLGGFEKSSNAVEIKIEASGLPIVEQHRPGCMALPEAKLPCPGVQLAAHRAYPSIAPDPDHGGCSKRFLRFQIIGGGKRVHAAERSNPLAVVVEAALKAARPGQGTAQNTTGILPERPVKRENEGGVAKLMRSDAVLGIEHLCAGSYQLRNRVHLVCPVAMEM